MDRYLDEMEEREREEEEDDLDLNLAYEPRVLWQRTNPMIEFNDAIFKGHFRFTKANFLTLVDLLQPTLQVAATKRMSPLSPLQKTALGLLFMASDSFQRVCGVVMGIKVSCANKALHEFITAVCELSHDLITLPTFEEMTLTSQFISQKYGLGGVAMGVDGSPARLGIQPYAADLPDGLTPQDFWSRKQFYGINFQIAGDHQRLIRDLVCTFPGSAHDSRVYRSSSVKDFIEGQGHFFLVGDSAYPLSRWMVKPISQREVAGNPQRRAFNRALSGARTELTENILAIVKQRWPILRMGIRMQPERASKVILSACVLHNFAMNLRDPLPDEDDPAGPHEDNTDDDDDDDDDGDDEGGAPGGPVAGAAGEQIPGPEENNAAALRADVRQANFIQGRLFRDQLMNNGRFR